MKIPIKFRGRDVETGEYVYADLGQVSSEYDPTYLTFIIGEEVHLIISHSVAQLVGYDKNGAEVYEGDILEFDFEDPQKSGAMMHYEYVAHLKGFATRSDGCYIPCEKFKEVSKPEAARRE